MAMEEAMSTEHECPSCGELERLIGQREQDRIMITCEACGHSWVRGETRCRTCGGREVVRRPQPMSRQPRGNQVSIVGWREVLLCRSCDAEVARESLAKNRPVPEDYVAKATRHAGAPAHTPRSTPPSAAPSLPPRTTSRNAPTAQRPSDQGNPPPAIDVSGDPYSRGSARSADPTVRQAIEAYLNAEGATADSLAMLMLGTHLGPATRLSQLDRPDTPPALRAWIEATWPPNNPRRAGALESVDAALRFWAGQRWLSTECEMRLAASLAPKRGTGL